MLLRAPMPYPFDQSRHFQMGVWHKETVSLIKRVEGLNNTLYIPPPFKCYVNVINIVAFLIHTSKWRNFQNSYLFSKKLYFLENISQDLQNRIIVVVIILSCLILTLNPDTNILEISTFAIESFRPCAVSLRGHV